MSFLFPLFALPLEYIIIIYVLSAILPAFSLMRYVYRHDTVEKEPPWLLRSLVFNGLLAALVSIVFEGTAQSVIDETVAPDDPIYIYLIAFLAVAAVEEGAKFFFLYKRTWKDPNFNYRFDGIVYATFVSLGFAAFENILYVFRYGLSVSLPRALLSIPGHACFAVLMGVFYGRAKLRSNMGNERGKKLNLTLCYLSAVLLHGIYDSCCMVGTPKSLLVFVIFVISMYLVVFWLIKRESKTNAPV